MAQDMHTSIYGSGADKSGVVPVGDTGQIKAAQLRRACKERVDIHGRADQHVFSVQHFKVGAALLNLIQQITNFHKVKLQFNQASM